MTRTSPASTWYAEGAYQRAVGDALALGIKVYLPGGAPKPLGDLRAEIHAVQTYQPRHRAEVSA